MRSFLSQQRRDGRLLRRDRQITEYVGASFLGKKLGDVESRRSRGNGKNLYAGDKHLCVYLRFSLLTSLCFLLYTFYETASPRLDLQPEGNKNKTPPFDVC